MSRKRPFNTYTLSVETMVKVQELSGMFKKNKSRIVEGAIKNYYDMKKKVNRWKTKRERNGSMMEFSDGEKLDSVKPLHSSKQTHKEYSHGESKTKFAETVSAESLPALLSRW